MLKKIGIILGSIVVILIALFFILTKSVDQTAFYNTDYYQKSCVLTDSLKQFSSSVTDSIQAGFAKVSITPGLNNPSDQASEGKFNQVPLAGFGARKGKAATGVHDSIFVKAVALKAGARTIIFVGSDLLIMPPNIIDTVSIILEKQGIYRDQVVFSASHTHSSIGAWGPGFIGEQFAGKANRNIQKWLATQISKVVLAAAADLQPARIGYGTFNAGAYTRNRLIGEKGIKNDDFAFVYLEQRAGKKAVMGSFSAHSTTMGAGNMEISGDYPGYWQRKMETTSVDLAVFFAGSVGSQSPVGEGKDFEKPRFIGEALADSLNVYLPKIKTENSITLSAVSVKLPLPEYHIRITDHRGLTSSVSKKLMPYPMNPYLQAVRIGQFVWISAPADFSGEYAVQIKNNLTAKGFQANVSSFNGSYLGYIIPGRYFYLDEYESKTMGWFGPNMGEYTMDVIRRISEIATSK
ncbi:MAG: neutral/alkaline non-lysosomal ceramidase N-terminal domain-containing protein [Prolixibacteraceae bacterium]|nr:neutral/alkaline non-lysosomal ceramidase N-terminal domain-containing protein [Prolixibacteraceae bacterium]